MAQGLLLNDNRRHDGQRLAEGAGSTIARDGREWFSYHTFRQPRKPRITSFAPRIRVEERVMDAQLKSENPSCDKPASL